MAGETQLISAIAGSGGLLGAIKVWIIPFLKKWRRNRAEDRRKLAEIHYELKDTGNGSLHTKVVTLTDNFNSFRETVIETLSGLEDGQKLILNIQNIAFWLSGEDGECVYASPALCKLLGRSETEILGNNWSTWIIPEDRKRIRDAWEISVQDRATFDELYTFRKSDGHRIKVHGLAFHKKNGRPGAQTMGRLEKQGEPYKTTRGDHDVDGELMNA